MDGRDVHHFFINYFYLEFLHNKGPVFLNRKKNVFFSDALKTKIVTNKIPAWFQLTDWLRVCVSNKYFARLVT